MNQLNGHKIIRFSLGCLITVFFLWLILRQISFSEIKVALYAVNLYWVLLACLLFLLGYACRIERWRLMLTQENPVISWRECAGPLLASMAANNILPFRAGDILRAFAFNRRLNISAATSVTTLLVERLLDLLMVIFYLGGALAFFGMHSSSLLGVSASVLIAIGIAILFVLLFPQIFKPLAFWFVALLTRLNTTLGAKIKIEVTKVFNALEYTAHGLVMLRLVAWSFLAWLGEGLVFWFAALSLPAIFNALAAWLAFPIATLVTVFPSTPGYIGTFDYAIVQSMVTLNNAEAPAAAYAFLVHAIIWILPILIGGGYLILNPIKNKQYVEQKRL